MNARTLCTSLVTRLMIEPVALASKNRNAQPLQLVVDLAAQVGHDPRVDQVPAERA